VLIMSNRSTRRVLVAALLALAGLALVGCGGAVQVALTAQHADGITQPDRRPRTARFDRPEFAITFDYPAGLTERTDVTVGSQAGTAGAQDVDVAVALGRQDMIVVDRHQLSGPVTEADLDRAKVEFDGLAAQFAGQPASGTELTVAGLPALAYSVPLRRIETGQSQFTVIFDGATQYTMNCQSTAAHRSEMASACRTALDTLRRR